MHRCIDAELNLQWNTYIKIQIYSPLVFCVVELVKHKFVSKHEYVYVVCIVEGGGVKDVCIV